MAKRLEERKIKTSLSTRGHIEYRLHERWLKWFLKSMEGREVRLSSDFRPLGVFFNLSYWNALFSPYLTELFRWFEGLSLGITALLMAVFTLLLTGIFIKRPRTSRYSVPYAIFTTGLTGMIFDLAIIFTFQTLYGYLYYQIALLVTLFMAGVALSGLWVTQRLDRIRNDFPLFLATELFIALFSVLLPFVFSTPSQYLEKPAVSILLYTLFLTVCSATIGPVLKSLTTVKREKVWLEIVNLVVPTLNDDMKMIDEMCRWIKDNLGTDTPLHFTRFFPNYTLTHLSPTPIATLEAAYEIAKRHGLRYVYIGNVPGHMHNSTFCPSCNRKVIHRTHFDIREMNMKDAKCRFCNFPIEGIWA